MGNLTCEMTSRRDPLFPPAPLTRGTFAPYGLENPSGGWKKKKKKTFAIRDTESTRAAGVNTAQLDKQGLAGNRHLNANDNTAV